LGKYGDRVIGAYPNASSLDQRDLERSGHIVTVKNPEQTAAYLAHLSHAFDLRLVGGCCGFGSEEIGKISRAVTQRIRSSKLPTTDVIYEN
jgi:methionine synthase I (cobalamin-dependent)